MEHYPLKIVRDDPCAYVQIEFVATVVGENNEESSTWWENITSQTVNLP